ncbi:GumC family protein [Hyphomicrobium sp.]|jgi:uncharacterized protein involved in exopolysaccharide biosynthesis|uniref:GumC family protein n=1 Tax=Hyphomicrobium sp. TaxID=82 RepID=UPI0039C8611A
MRWLIPASLVLGSMTYAILSFVAPRYQSEAELAIVAKGVAGTFADRNSAAGPDLVTTRMDKEAINTHVRAMQSPELMEKIANDLKLAERPEFNSALGPVDKLDAVLRYFGIGGPRKGETTRDRVLDAFRNRLEVYAAKESRFIGVRMTSNDPALAAKIANALAENYRASLAEQGVSEVDDVQSVLEAKVKKLSAEVAAAETEVDRYRGKIDGFSGGTQNIGLNAQQMSELTAELTKAKAARGEAEVRAKSAREMVKLGSADQLADVQKSPLIQNLVQQRVRIERQISELSATLLPGHPRMRQLRADLAGLKVQINGEISKIVDSLEKEASVAKGREESIEQSLADIKARVVTNAPEEAQLRQLEATAKAKRTELENIQAQLESNRKRLDARAQPVAAQIIAKAQPESVPVFPRKGALSALITLASLMFGTAAIVTTALFREARRSSASDVPHAKSAISAPVGKRWEPSLLPQSEPLLREMSDDAETAPPLAAPVAAPASAAELTDVEALAGRLVNSRHADSGHRTLLAGEADAVDPKQEAMDLVERLTQKGAQVILIDWNSEGRGIAKAIGLDPNVGWNELLRAEATFGEIIQRIPGSSAHAIASGKALGFTADAIDRERLNLALDALDEAYDHIVVAGTHDEARKLFEMIEGRFDTGVVVAEARGNGAKREIPAGTFLDFEVADIDVVRLERTPSQTEAIHPRIARVTQRRNFELVQGA